MTSDAYAFLMFVAISWDPSLNGYEFLNVSSAALHCRQSIPCVASLACCCHPSRRRLMSLTSAHRSFDICVQTVVDSFRLLSVISSVQSLSCCTALFVTLRFLLIPRTSFCSIFCRMLVLLSNCCSSC